jgi:molybdopterin converting factor subunit 1
MSVTVLYFGTLKDLFGLTQEALDVPDGTTVEALLSVLRARTSKQSDIWRSLAVAVNRDYAGVATVLREGDEVALLPPVSGGSSGGSQNRCEA